MNRFKEKKKGSVSLMLVLALALSFISISWVIIRCEAYFTVINDYKNKSDMSNLSTYKNISQNELATSGKIIFEESNLTDVITTFKGYLIDNYKLNENLKRDKKGTLNKVEIEKIIVYSVKDDMISEFEYTPGTGKFNLIKSNFKGEIKTPNGRTVKKTSVYTEININTNVMLNINKNVIIKSYTDIVNR